MNVSTALCLRWSHWVWVCFLLSSYFVSAWAQEVSITAVFQPDSAHPQLNKFTNTTPPSGYCVIYPEQCKLNNTFSLQVPIQFDSNAAILANHASERQGAMLIPPSQWRELTVAHEKTGELETVKVRIVGIGSNLMTDDVIKLVGGITDDYREAHNFLWGSSWVNAPSPCQYSGVGSYTSRSYRFFWKTPTQGVCAKQAKFDIPSLRYQYLDFAYELVTPNPLGMSSGKYVGQLTYTLGPGTDFDMGDVMMPSSSTLILNFALDVQHTLKVDIPPGGNRVELVPQGGWQDWLQQGRKPTRLFRDQTFNISASSRFKMQLVCEISGLQDCMIRDPVSRRTARVLLSVSLPNGLTDLTGQPVRRYPLHNSVHGQKFQPGFYVDRAPGILHFEISSYEMDYMLRPGEAATYAGNITVIWDSEV